MAKKQDPKLREFAQRENDYILSILLRPERHKGGREDPLELAERNCGATEESFGKSDPLHVMALNTFAFVQLQRQKHTKKAQKAAHEAVQIIKTQAGQEELLLESRSLLALAIARVGSPQWAAFAQAFEVPERGKDPEAGMKAAGEFLGEMLHRYTYQQPLERVILLMATRELSMDVLKELDDHHVEATQDRLKTHLIAFLEIYFGPKDGD
jgi:hypothetical protein